jgi:hypothetical protein
MNLSLYDGMALLGGLLLSGISMKIPGGTRLLYAIIFLVLAIHMYAEGFHGIWSWAPLILAPGLLWYGGIMRGVVVLSVLYAFGVLFAVEGWVFWATLGALPGFYFLYRKKFEHPFWEGIYLKIKKGGVRGN